ncbi:MAG TPA: metallophosphoesterase [Acidobacteriaceae bacterium]|jgi:3',5'-cyclic AMP phosphodiesterase CpdA|nr:metallophosphoesterase [Acidobacteriaceae bacterium]
MRRLVLALSLLVALCPFAATAQQPQQPWFFAVVADPQFGMYANDANFSQEIANFELVVASLNRLHPAFVVVDGDFINRTGDAAEIAGYKSVLKQLDPSIPVHAAAGNHDVGNVPSKSNITAYRANFGWDYYSFEQNGLLGIVLDSSLVGAPLGYPAATSAQLSWLKKTLASSAAEAAEQVVVFQHIPYFMHEAGEANSYYNLPLSMRGTYLNLLINSGVEWVFSGHLHNLAGGPYGNLTQWITGAVGMPIGSSGSGITLVAVNGHTLQPVWYCLAGLPNTFNPASPPTTACSK